MRILIGCEESATVRDAFLARGHDAWSCDLVPSRGGPQHHLQMDVFDAVKYDGPWDMLIAFPPCTYVAVSGARWFKSRIPQQTHALLFMRDLMHAPVRRIALENPIGIFSTYYRQPDQIIQPWQFGEDASKATCLWLKNLPLLLPTNVLPGGRAARRANQTPSGQNKLGPSPTRARDRGKTYQGLADAMAEQWGKL